MYPLVFVLPLLFLILMWLLLEKIEKIPVVASPGDFLLMYFNLVQIMANLMVFFRVYLDIIAKILLYL